MAYYNYHAQLRKLLETVEYEVVKGKGDFAYRFNFANGKSMPIREYRVFEYLEFLN